MASNRFSEAERIGRDKTVMLLHNYQLVESKNPYEVWDFSGTTSTFEYEDRPFFIEVKNRGIKSTDYTSVYLEYDKFKRLIDVADNNGQASVFYIMYFADNVSLIYNLRNINLMDVNIKMQSLPSTTMGENTNIDKLIVELPYKLAQRRKLKI